jgi:hypothetical protein
MNTPVQTLFQGPEALVPGTLRGYRTWRLTLGGRLVSTAMESLWDDDVNEATCFSPLKHPGVAVPDARCQCGFYGWYAPDDSRIVPSDVFGVIEASARVISASRRRRRDARLGDAGRTDAAPLQGRRGLLQPEGAAEGVPAG